MKKAHVTHAPSFLTTVKSAVNQTPTHVAPAIGNGPLAA